MQIATTFDTYMEETNLDVEKALDLAKQDGFDAIGIMIKEQVEYYQKIKQHILNSDLKICIHSNLIDTNLASSNQGIRAESVRQLKQEILLAKELNASILTFHPGKFQNIHNVQEAYLLLDLSLKEVLPVAKQNNILLCLENMDPGYHYLCVSQMQVHKVLERHPSLNLTFDIAHAAMVSDSEQELINFYLSFQDRIKHFHISGIKPRISHVEVSLKESNIDFTNFLNSIKDTPNLLRIENRERSKNLQSLKFIKDIINN